MFVQLHVILVLAYLMFAIWPLSRWFQYERSEPSWRNRFGSIRLAFGVGSIALLASFYIYVWTYRELPAHGMALWAYFLAGAALSIAGMVLGSIGIGNLRQSTLLISLAAFFEWLRELVAGA